MTALFALLCAPLSACDGDESSPDSSLYPDAWGPRDLRVATDVNTNCTLGQPNSCATCTDVCPGNDDEHTVRTCDNRSCGVACKVEAYDADGDPATGCEALDDLPLHNTVETAIHIGNIEDEDSQGGTISGFKIPSDARKHLDAPESRLTGRPDFFTLDIEDTLGDTVDPFVRLDATALPSTVTLELKLIYACTNGDKTVIKNQKPVQGGTAGEVTFNSLECFGTGSETGRLTIEVVKTSTTTHSAAEYSLIYHG